MKGWSQLEITFTGRPDHNSVSWYIVHNYAGQDVLLTPFWIFGGPPANAYVEVPLRGHPSTVLPWILIPTGVANAAGHEPRECD